jgi:hypothetical protein
MLWINASTQAAQTSRSRVLNDGCHFFGAPFCRSSVLFVKVLWTRWRHISEHYFKFLPFISQALSGKNSSLLYNGQSKFSGSGDRVIFCQLVKTIFLCMKLEEDHREFQVFISLYRTSGNNLSDLLKLVWNFSSACCLVSESFSVIIICK